MPRGGARKGAGRKPKPLAEKLAVYFFCEVMKNLHITKSKANVHVL